MLARRVPARNRGHGARLRRALSQAHGRWRLLLTNSHAGFDGPPRRLPVRSEIIGWGRRTQDNDFAFAYMLDDDICDDRDAALLQDTISAARPLGDALARSGDTLEALMRLGRQPQRELEYADRKRGDCKAGQGVQVHILVRLPCRRIMNHATSLNRRN